VSIASIRFLERAPIDLSFIARSSFTLMRSDGSCKERGISRSLLLKQVLQAAPRFDFFDLREGFDGSSCRRLVSGLKA
jgi:hypothetical protein